MPILSYGFYGDMVIPHLPGLSGNGRADLLFAENGKYYITISGSGDCEVIQQVGETANHIEYIIAMKSSFSVWKMSRADV